MKFSCTFTAQIVLIVINIALVIQIALKNNNIGLFITTIIETVAAFTYCAIVSITFYENWESFLKFGKYFRSYVYYAIFYRTALIFLCTFLLLVLSSFIATIVYMVELRKKYNKRMALEQAETNNQMV